MTDSCKDKNAGVQICLYGRLSSYVLGVRQRTNNNGCWWVLVGVGECWWVLVGVDVLDNEPKRSAGACVGAGVVCYKTYRSPRIVTDSRKDKNAGVQICLYGHVSSYDVRG